MTDFPIPLDNLIAYVQSMHPNGGPLDNLADAVIVAARIEEQSDALLGHFVDQARRSGASWSQIGTSMGVSKQAAQKRFVPRFDGTDPIPEGQAFSRFTRRARNTLGAAGRIAEQAGAQEIDASHLAVALLSEPEGLAAKIIYDTGATDERIGTAFGLALPSRREDTEPAALRELRFADAGKAALRGALKAVLRLGHNYVGTEHLLLGILFADDSAAETLTSFGLSVELVETALAEEITRILEQRQAE